MDLHDKMATGIGIDLVSGCNIQELNEKLLEHLKESSFSSVDELSEKIFPGVFAALKNILSPLKKNSRYANIEFLWTGSTSEGVNVPGFEKNGTGYSLEFEMDMLCVIKDVKIGRTKDDPVILMLQEGTTHGYFLVYVNDPEYRRLWQDCCTRPTASNRQGEFYLNPLKLVRDLYANIEHIYRQIPVLRNKFKLEFNPPAVTMTLADGISLGGHMPSVYVSCDIVVALEMPYTTLPEAFPLVFNKSEKPVWLSNEAFSRIKSETLHLVGKQSPRGHPEIEWRLSFNRIELTFFQELREKYPVSVVCYRLFKLIRMWHLKEPKILPSYFLKMLFFTACARLPPTVWSEDKIAYCLLGLVDDLIHCLSTRFLPSYFVPSYNLLEGRHPDFIQTLLDRLVAIRREPVTHVIDVKF